MISRLIYNSPRLCYLKHHWQHPVWDSFPPPHPVPLSGLRAPSTWAPSTWGPCCGPCCYRDPNSDHSQQPQPGQRHQGGGTTNDGCCCCSLPCLLSLVIFPVTVSLQIKEENIIPQIKLEPHEVDQFLNLSPKGQKFPLPPLASQLSDAATTPAGHLFTYLIMPLDCKMARVDKITDAVVCF